MRGAALALLLAALVSAVAARAETEAASFGIGISPADPDDTALLGEGVEVTAVLVNERTGSDAAVVERPDTIRLLASLRSEPGAPDRALLLTCAIGFYAADGTLTEATEGACFRGTLRAGDDGPRRLNLTFRFRPSADDPAGTAGIRLHLFDAATGDEAIVVPTYDWRGGR